MVQKATIGLFRGLSDKICALLAQIACRIYEVPTVFARFDDANYEKLVEDLPIRGIFPFTLSLAEFEKDFEFLFGEED